MANVDLTREISIKISLGHLILAWETMSSKLSDLNSNTNLSPEEKKAIWALADLLESSLVDNGVSAMHKDEWSALIAKATQFIKAMPADFLE